MRVILDGRTLTPAQVAAVAREGRPVSLDDAARARNAAAAEALAALLEAGTPVYGVTTGVGALRSRELGPSERSGHQLRLLRSHACGAGRPLAPERVRAAMVVRANQIGAGGAGVSDDLLDASVAALNAGFVPFSRELGSLGHRRSHRAGRHRPGAARRGPRLARRASRWRRRARSPRRAWSLRASGRETGWPS